MTKFRKKPTTILILGCLGMLGHKMVQVLSTEGFKVIGTVRKLNPELVKTARFDKSVRIIEGVSAEDIPALRQVIQTTKPAVIVNCIGITRPPKTNSGTATTIQVNALFPHRACRVAQEFGARFIHISTDCVYDSVGSRHAETESTNPMDVYGLSKLLGEVSSENTLTIRTSIFGPELASGKSLYEWFKSKRGQEIQGFERVIYSGLSTLELSKFMARVIHEFPQLHGIYNVSSEPISKFKILELLNKKLGLGVSLTQETQTNSDRSLDPSRLFEATGYNPPAWPQMLQEMVDDDRTPTTSTSTPSFCVVLPMFNEEACAQQCVRSIFSHIKTLPARTGIVCVDDGSTDRTYELLSQLRAEVPILMIEKHAVNQGYGGANVTGAKHALREKFDYVLFMDGDLTQRVTYIDDFYRQMQKGTDFIKATRYSKGGGVDGVPFKRWFVSYAGNLLAKMFFRLPLRDYTNGFRAIRSELVTSLDAKERGFAYLIEEVYQLSKVAKTYAEIPYILTVRQDVASVSKFSYSFRTYYNYLKYLVKK